MSGNQGALHEEVEGFFTTATEDAFASVVHDDAKELDKGHGRLEVRRNWMTGSPLIRIHQDVSRTLTAFRSRPRRNP